MTDRMSFFDNLSELEERLVATLTHASDIKSDYQKILTENTSLRIENARLRDRLAELSELETPENKQKQADKKVPMSNLQEIYDDGFHVCREYYGKHLESGEGCLYCGEILYR
ncbi:MAG: initiation control protein YabA [Streptococcaceae bacterium]|jgi:regulator of replication initiation timing|nr:initiation control protein YabA [Streptococcaceae bacterium]